MRAVAIGAVALLIAALSWVLFYGLPNWTARRAVVPALTSSASTAPAEVRKIKARLFFVADNGTKLKGVEQDVPYGEGTVEQAKAILNAQLTPPSEGLVSALPNGTRLRAVFVTAKGDAYVDFSSDLVSAHPGGSMSELLTVHTIVHALTNNLPGITAVQILVEGKEVDTLAGHVDLRRPLARDAAWVE